MVCTIVQSSFDIRAVNAHNEGHRLLRIAERGPRSRFSV